MAHDQRELRYREKQIEFSRRWYQAHVRRAENVPDYEAERSSWQRGSPAGRTGQNVYRFLEFCTGHRLPASPPDRESQFAELVAELDDNAGRFEQVADWWHEKQPIFLDRVLVDRCDYGFHNPDEVPREVRKSNADALVAIADYLGPALIEDVSNAAGLPLKTWKLPVYWVPTTKAPRPDLWVDWRVEGEGLWEIGLRLWISHKGAAIGVMPGWIGKGWKPKAQEVIASTQIEGLRTIERGDDEDMAFFGRIGSFFYGCSYKPEDVADLDLKTELTRVATAARPLLKALISRARAVDPPPTPPPDLVAEAVAQFLRDTGYPTARDEEQRAHQSRFRQMLLTENLGTGRLSQLRRIWTSSDYGYPGMHAYLNAAVNAADDTEYQRILETFGYVCWGADDDAERIDRVLKDPVYRVKGLAESVTLKLLAICHPDRYLCVYPYSRENGKLRMLKALSLPEPPEKATRGHKHVESNDRLRERLEPFFPDDPWGMRCFLYWYVDWDGPRTPGGNGKGPQPDPIDSAAADLLIDRSFLDDIVGLLKDKGQVILYGPPGTGKTFLARRLAKALAPGSEDRALVQFHPSTSYEDFFEGYRPEEGPGGQIVYRLTPGPLARMAERAAEYPHRPQVMIIDEINRANLPKALGELLFLFEYRDRSISTLYRPDGEFELPKSLWFIGTMNTADRSIALVDAALRRRFHFIPFFPDRGPTAGLLQDWLKNKEEPSWVGKLIEMVNEELTEAIGSDLQLGPSHFMKTGYPTEPDPEDVLLRRIWEYNIEPLIEDQLFGDPGRIERFRFKNVIARYRSSLEPDGGPASDTPAT